MITDTLLDLHAKLSTVVRYYDRMLEERLTNAYSNHNLGYGAVSGAAQYPSIQPGAEDFYYGKQVDNSRPPTTYGPPDPMKSPIYTSQAQHGAPRNDSYAQNWAPVPYPPNNAAPIQHPAASMPSGSNQYHAGPQPPIPGTSLGPEAPFSPSPAMQRNSQFEYGASPHGAISPPEQQSSTGHVPPQDYSVQSYYHSSQPQPQPQASHNHTGSVGYPAMANAQQATYPPDTSDQKPYQQSSRPPVEESLIEL